jgi:predicted dehydrogenase
MIRNMPVRMGIIGAGNIGKAYAVAIESSSTVRLSAVCDVDGVQAKSVVDETEAVAFESHEALAESGTCDAVIIATPPITHAGVAIDCLNSGLDVLCEKPFTLTIESAYDMFNVAAREDRLLAMASKFRYVPDIAQARDLIRAGAVGEPTVVDVTFASPVDMSNRWNSVPAVSGGGVLIDNGTHAVDIVRYLVGPISRVSAMRGRLVGEDEVEDTAIILAETERQAIINIQVSWSMAAHNESYVVVRGTGGTLRIGWAESMLRRSDGSDWTTFGSGYSKMEALRSNVEDFAACTLGYDPMRISTSDIMASILVVDGAYRAIRSRQWIDIEDAAWSAATDRIAASSRV